VILEVAANIVKLGRFPTAMVRLANWTRSPETCNKRFTGRFVPISPASLSVDRRRPLQLTCVAPLGGLRTCVAIDDLSDCHMQQRNIADQIKRRSRQKERTAEGRAWGNTDFGCSTPRQGVARSAALFAPCSFAPKERPVRGPALVLQSGNQAQCRGEELTLHSTKAPKAGRAIVKDRLRTVERRCPRRSAKRRNNATK